MGASTPTGTDPTAQEPEGLARRLDRPMGALGLVLVLVVLGQSLARRRGWSPR